MENIKITVELTPQEFTLFYAGIGALVLSNPMGVEEDNPAFTSFQKLLHECRKHSSTDHDAFASQVAQACDETKNMDMSGNFQEVGEQFAQNLTNKFKTDE